MTVLTLLLLFVTAALIAMTSIAVVNTLTFPRLRRTAAPLAPGAYPRLAVLIPARNEAAVIAATIRSLLAQEYPNARVILLDDGSDDGTGEIARAAADGDPRLRILNGSPLLPGWLGKNWACHQLAQSALSELEAPDDVLIFTDADVTWEPGALTALVHMLTRHRVDLLTVWSTQTTITWGERLVVPLMALVILGYLPALLTNRTRWSAFAAANGQCLAFRRAAYQAVGGHAAVKSSIVEDITFARRIKRKGLRLWMADGAGLVVCRMYRSWQQVRDGYAKNIIAGYGSVFGLALGAVFHWLVFLLPPIVLIVSLFNPVTPLSPWWELALTALGIGVRALTAAATRQRVIDALWMPVSALLMTRIAAQALYWQLRYGGPQWKGRTIRRGAA
ncbi:MAG: glycosyltransferase [bacterium]|nr:glycosyltransferase [bacterium]